MPGWRQQALALARRPGGIPFLFVSAPSERTRPSNPQKWRGGLRAEDRLMADSGGRPALREAGYRAAEAHANSPCASRNTNIARFLSAWATRYFSPTKLPAKSLTPTTARSPAGLLASRNPGPPPIPIPAITGAGWNELRRIRGNRADSSRRLASARADQINAIDCL